MKYGLMKSMSNLVAEILITSTTKLYLNFKLLVYIKEITVPINNSNLKKWNSYPGY